jgi:thiol-disulfide isomerase/thioredoxin
MFLKAIAERSPNRIVQGQATLGLAEYLKIKSMHVEMLQNTDAPGNIEKMRLLMASIFGPRAESGYSSPITDTPANLRKEREDLAKHAPDYLRHLLSADPVALRLESERLYAQVIAKFADVPYVRVDMRPTRETLADAARRGRRPATTIGYDALEQSFRAAVKSAQQASDALGPNEAGVKAYLAKAPKWADFGPKMWQLAANDPRSAAAFDALLWIAGNSLHFFDAADERAGTLGKAIDVLIRDHLGDLAANLAARNVATAFNHGYPVPGPHINRLYRALYERAPDRETRGRMGLALARQLKAEADLADSFASRGTDPNRRPEMAMWPRAYVERLRKADCLAIRREAEMILEHVKAEYGDVKHLTGEVISKDTLAVVTDRELTDVRTIAVGQPAPEIQGQDIDGKPMTLSEFRGKVVLLDFGSHEHCGACRLVYPRLRQIVEQYRARPFVVLGVNTGDHRDVLRQLHSKGEITWRSLWDGEDFNSPGPITTRWNIQGYPTFIILDHHGMIRFKDLHPYDNRGFDEAIGSVIKEAEASR